MSEKEFPLVLKGERIELKALEPTFENAKMIHKVVAENREHLLAWLSWASTDRTDKPEDFFNVLQKWKENRKNNTEFAFGILLDKKYIGNISIFDISDKKKSGEIGYWLAKNETGQGFMFETVKLLEDAVFQYGLNRIQIRCNTKNNKSANIPKKLNYHLDGESRQDNIDEDGKFSNTFIFSKLKPEWEIENKKQTDK